MQLKMINDLAKHVINYSSKEHDLFMLICFKLQSIKEVDKDKNGENYYLSIEKNFIKENLYPNTNISNTTINGMIDSFSNLKIAGELKENIINEKNVIIAQKGLKYIENPIKRVIESNNKDIFMLEVAPYLIDSLRNITKDFTILELKEMFSLKSKHSKTLYRLIKESLYKNILEIEVELLKIYFDCPPSAAKLYVFERDYVKKAVDEINKNHDENSCSFSIDYEKIGGGKNGKKVTAFKFNINSEMKISEELEKAIEKAKKNIYISKAKAIDLRYLNSLVINYGEEKVIVGLKKVYESIKSTINAKNPKAYFKKCLENEINKIKEDRTVNRKNEIKISSVKPIEIEILEEITIEIKKTRPEIIIFYLKDWVYETLNKVHVGIVNKELQKSNEKLTTLEELKIMCNMF